eukprot:m.43584 g.43584  ORF g.43584 m.43584 type:complete len:85 (-) comp10562_c0_seq1:1276-1530(-)
MWCVNQCNCNCVAYEKTSPPSSAKSSSSLPRSNFSSSASLSSALSSFHRFCFFLLPFVVVAVILGSVLSLADNNRGVRSFADSR